MIADFRDLLTLLVARDVRFLVVGAHALAALGVPRVTGDLDIWVEPTPDNAQRIWLALVEFGAPLAAMRISESDFANADQVIQLGLPPYRIDILTSISGVTFDQARAGAFEGTLFDVGVLFLGREEFLKNKRASGRPRDLEDVRSLGG